MCSFVALGGAAVVINSVLFRYKFSTLGAGQMGCTGPGERGKRPISGGSVGPLKVDGAQDRWMACPEVSVCQFLCCHWTMSR